MAGMSFVSASITVGLNWTCQQNQTGAEYNPVGVSGSLSKSYAVGTSAPNGSTGGGDEVFSFQQAVGAGAVAVLDLTAMTDQLLRAGVNIARIKGWLVRVLSASDDSTISPAPVATSQVVVTNNPPSTVGMDVPNQLDFGNGGSGLTLTLTVAAGAVTGVAIGTAGSGYPKSSTFLVAPNQAGGSAAVVAVTTNSSGVPTTVALVAGGAGYAAATVPTTVLGQYAILTGGAHVYFDPAAAGFALVTATSRKIAFVNLDGANAVTLELSFLPAST